MKKNGQDAKKTLDLTNFTTLYESISKSTYTKRSAQLLKSLIDDMKQQKMILIFSKKHSRKVQFLNQLFGRELWQNHMPSSSYSTSIVQYGEQEKIKGHFLDGQIADFELHNLSLFHTHLNEGTEILQQGVDYLDVFLDNSLLQNITLIDVGTIETSEKFTYIPPSALKRADDVIWLVDDAEELTIGELRLIERMKKMNIQPLAITYNQQTTIASNVFRNCVHEADHASIYLELLNTQPFKLKHETKLIERFIQWVERFEIEVSNLLKREPYVGAYAQLMEIVHHPELENTTPVGDLQIELTHLIKQYESIQTLYQFVQFIRQHPFITSEEIIQFATLSTDYMEAAHHYRRIVKEYQREIVSVETMQRKKKSKLLLPFLPKDLEQKIEKGTEALVEKYEEIQHTLKATERLEKAILHDFEKMNDLLYENVQKEMAQYESKNQKQSSKKVYKTRRFTATQRLKSFDSIVKTKQLLQPILMELHTTSKGLLDEWMIFRLEKVAKQIELLPLEYKDLLMKIEEIPSDDNVHRVIAVPIFEKIKLTNEQIILPIEKNVVIW